MPVEIERKFIVVGERWNTSARGVLYRQGYLATAKECAVRVRVGRDTAYLTIKSAKAGTTRAEFEYEIPVSDANEMLANLCNHHIVDKTRYTLQHGGMTWEVDEFHGSNEGLVLAEVELTRADQLIKLPDWVGEEVTHDKRYYNANLATNPFSKWRD